MPEKSKGSQLRLKSTQAYAFRSPPRNQGCILKRRKLVPVPGHADKAKRAPVWNLESCPFRERSSDEQLVFQLVALQRWRRSRPLLDHRQNLVIPVSTRELGWRPALIRRGQSPLFSLRSISAHDSVMPSFRNWFRSIKSLSSLHTT
jgi:hypothetical protein